MRLVLTILITCVGLYAGTHNIKLGIGSFKTNTARYTGEKENVKGISYEYIGNNGFGIGATRLDGSESTGLHIDHVSGIYGIYNIDITNKLGTYMILGKANSTVVNDNSETSITDTMYGVGVKYNFSRKLGAYVEYTVYADKTHEADNIIYGLNTKGIMTGLIYTFGDGKYIRKPKIVYVDKIIEKPVVITKIVEKPVIKTVYVDRNITKIVKQECKKETHFLKKDTVKKILDNNVTFRDKFMAANGTMRTVTEYMTFKSRTIKVMNMYKDRKDCMVVVGITATRAVCGLYKDSAEAKKHLTKGAFVSKVSTIKKLINRSK